MPNPFGVELGSTPSAATAEFRVKFRDVPSRHPDLSEYQGIWHPVLGLTRVWGWSALDENDRSGFRSRQIYDRLKDQLSRVYGRAEEHEIIDRDSYFGDYSDFIHSIYLEDRIHGCRWVDSNSRPLGFGISSIYLSIVALDRDQSQVLLKYSSLPEGHSDQDRDQHGIEAL